MGWATFAASRLGTGTTFRTARSHAFPHVVDHLLDLGFIDEAIVIRVDFVETFFQPGNCLDCHTDAFGGTMLGTPANPDGFSGGLSHIWAAIQPLFH